MANRWFCFFSAKLDLRSRGLCALAKLCYAAARRRRRVCYHRTLLVNAVPRSAAASLARSYPPDPIFGPRLPYLSIAGQCSRAHNQTHDQTPIALLLILILLFSSPPAPVCGHCCPLTVHLLAPDARLSVTQALSSGRVSLLRVARFPWARSVHNRPKLTDEPAPGSSRTCEMTCPGYCCPMSACMVSCVLGLTIVNSYNSSKQ